MKSIFYAGLILLSVSVYSQKKADEMIEVTYNQSADGIVVFAFNKGLCPYTIDIKFVTKNLVGNQEDQVVMVVPADGEKHKVITYEVKDKYKGYQFGLEYTYYDGDALGTEPDKDFVYALPFAKGETNMMSQGYQGKFSHEGKNALDFNMDEGSDVCAARDGIVVEIKEDSNRGCPSRECLNMANFIVIYHPEDGTFSQYSHLRRKGAEVAVGDQVSRGQVIGKSGNTGFSSGPHLHFVVYYYEKDQQVTIPTKFDTGSGEAEYLEEMTEYTAQ